ncbi:uncharacterized protein MONBRDRAFT_28715 [Monosiga brevicollis MX1]|uniref:Sialidase domain-containing protein n=1 Tax=Monosiga brevicollis TaxID=81824 RepID=A9V8Z4_MONBE|nr:uncharacterized protein MONBRDRAFT_28715 [Monosiga brevicollis MX1]EDQ85963.1 predicted protein [Monosiga brevicollis MX1]|eukprot:XP_001749157.1 hypothetical protein [Monosiga brevicollis MX1]
MPTLASHWAVYARVSCLRTVFEGGKEGYFCYRIPSLVQLGPDSYIAFAEGRKFSCEDHGWNDIVAKTSSDGGQTWSALAVVYGESSTKANITIGNPAPVVLHDGTLLLVFCRNNQAMLLLNSTDGGQTWGGFRDVSAGIVDPTWPFFATGPPGSIQLHTGRILVPADHTSGSTQSMAIYSDDYGQTWTRGAMIPDGNECQAVELPDGTVMMNMRTSQAHRQVAFSKDGGATWSDPVVTVNGTVCEGSTIMLPDSTGTLVQSFPNSNDRANVSIQTSTDGLSWGNSIQVYAGSSAYSSLQQANNNTAVALLLEMDSYQKIAFAMVSLV